MKKLLLILSLVAGVGSISAAGSDSGSDSGSDLLVDTTQTVAFKAGAAKAKVATMYAACTKANAKALPARAFNQATLTRPRAITTGVVTIAAVVFTAKKAYDRYKVWKNKKADTVATKKEVTA